MTSEPKWLNPKNSEERQTCEQKGQFKSKRWQENQFHDQLHERKHCRRRQRHWHHKRRHSDTTREGTQTPQELEAQSRHSAHQQPGNTKLCTITRQKSWKEGCQLRINGKDVTVHTVLTASGFSHQGWLNKEPWCNAERSREGINEANRRMTNEKLSAISATQQQMEIVLVFGPLNDFIQKPNAKPASPCHNGFWQFSKTQLWIGLFWKNLHVIWTHLEDHWTPKKPTKLFQKK